MEELWCFYVILGTNANLYPENRVAHLIGSPPNDNDQLAIMQVTIKSDSILDHTVERP